MSGVSPNPAEVAATDLLMRELYRRGRGGLHQTLLANFRLADALRRLQDAEFPIRPRAIERAAAGWWVMSSAVLGWRLALYFSGLVWLLLGLPDVMRFALRLHPDAFRREGSAEAPVILLRTGVANEVPIAKWIERREKAQVQLLQRDESAALQWPGLGRLLKLFRIHAGLCRSLMRDIESFLEAGLPGLPTRALVPTWLVMLARQAPDVSWAHLWAVVNLQGRPWQALYFTMNYSAENAFRLAIPGVPAAYVEHGFPRRDLPPLQCRQYVYTQQHADYLLCFDAMVRVEVIGLEYFAKGHVEPTRSIVVASLQDWPQYGVALVKDAMNQALTEARAAGWSLTFRTRHYDTDAFAAALEVPWDSISYAGSETFVECLHRIRPAMVWTSWSTAILDACAQDLVAVAFVHPSLGKYFLADLDPFAFVVSDASSLSLLCENLAGSCTEVVRWGATG